MTTATQTGARVGEYEVMFLASQGAAATLGQLLEHINEVFNRAGAEVIAMRKWDDRRLAFEIDKQKRGVYFLAYIRCAGDMVPHLERDVVVSEQLMRVLVTKADHLTLDEMRSHDQRQQLGDEARMRGNEAAAAEQSASRVRLGAPEQPSAEAPETEGGEDADTDEN